MRKQTISATVQPQHWELIEWYANQTNRSRSAVLDAAIKEMLAAKESSGFFHLRLLERLRGMTNDK